LDQLAQMELVVWQPLRRGRRVMSAGFGALALAVALILLQPLPWYMGALIALFWVGGLLTLLVGSYMAIYFRCPRCGRRFCVREGRWVHSRNPWAPRCKTCKLRRWAPQSEIRAKLPAELPGHRGG
jgi:hypothetical protein